MTKRGIGARSLFLALDAPEDLVEVEVAADPFESINVLCGNGKNNRQD